MRHFWPDFPIFSGPESVDGAELPSIRPPMAAAHPPPLFFEQRRYGASKHGILKNTLENTTSVDHAI